MADTSIVHVLYGDLRESRGIEVDGYNVSVKIDGQSIIYGENGELISSFDPSLVENKEDKGVVSGEVTELGIENLNSFRHETKHYRQSNPLNALVTAGYPEEGLCGYLSVHYISDGVVPNPGVVQMYEGFINGRTFKRAYQSGVWSGWQELASKRYVLNSITGKADINTVYTKAESDSRYEPLDSAYIKSESDAKYETIANVDILDGRVAALESETSSLDMRIDALESEPDYVLPIASTTTLGGVIADGVSILVDANGVISSVGGGGGMGDGYSQAEADAKFVDASGDNIDGDLYIRGQVHSIKNIGDSYIGVEDETNTDAMFMSLNETSMTLYNKTDVSEGNIVQVDRATGAVDSDYLAIKSDTYTKAEADGKFIDTTEEWRINAKHIGNTTTSTDLNTILEKGFYSSDAAANLFTNLPPNQTSGAFSLTVGGIQGDGSYGAQTLYDYITTKMFHRVNKTSTAHTPDWSPWAEVLTTDVAYSKADSDSRYVNVAGDTMTGNLYMGKDGFIASRVQNSAGNDYVQMYSDDGGVGMQTVLANYGTKAIFVVYKSDGRVVSDVFAMKTTTLLDNIQAVPATELALYKKDIQDKIIELEMKKERADLKGFTELSEEIEGQLVILNNKLNEI